MDCQKKGTQLTLIGILMGTAYGIVALNAVFMFAGVFLTPCRIMSVFFTPVVFLFQLAVQICVGVFMFTKYNNVCFRSLTNTFDGFRWTMADDGYTTFSLWVISFFTMIGIMMCGMCSAISPLNKTTITHM